MKNQKKKMIGAAAGAAAAATAVGIAAASFKNRKPTVLHVKPSDDAWVLAAEGKDSGTRFDIKRAAVQAGRELADSKAPSRLVIHRRDGTIQKQHSYEKDR